MAAGGSPCGTQVGTPNTEAMYSLQSPSARRQNSVCLSVMQLQLLILYRAKSNRRHKFFLDRFFFRKKRTNFGIDGNVSRQCKNSWV